MIAVLEIVAEEAKGKITLIAHVGCVSTAESQQLAVAAKRYGRRKPHQRPAQY
jgi:N-acetylneuraminate lyase